MNKCEIMIFAPHPDDEALGCAGVILEAVKKNKKVKIVVAANGESSVDGTERFYGHKPETEDFIDIGYVRQKESISAIKVLGLGSEDVIFLGYPNDSFLEMLSSDKYSGDSHYKSEFTKFDHISYKGSFNIGAPFCKESFREDIITILEQCKPKKVYVTHPQDSHFDHQACGKYLPSITREFDRSIRILGYIISKSKIPSPKRRLIYSFTGQLKEKYLDEATKKIKKECLGEYKSQEYLFDQLDFHYDVERFWKLEHGIRAKIAKKIFPDLRF